MRSPCVCVNFDSKAVDQSLHRLTIIPSILGSATLVIPNKSWELTTNYRKTMLELVRRISKPNVGHCRDDIEPPSTRKPSDRRERRIKVQHEAADENVHLATETSSPDMLLDLSAPESESTLTRSNSAAPGTADIVSMCARARSIQWSPWWLSLGQKTAARYSGISGFAAQQSDCPRVFRGD